MILYYRQGMLLKQLVLWFFLVWNVDNSIKNFKKYNVTLQQTASSKIISLVTFSTLNHIRQRCPVSQHRKRVKIKLLNINKRWKWINICHKYLSGLNSLYLFRILLLLTQFKVLRIFKISGQPEVHNESAEIVLKQMVLWFLLVWTIEEL